MTHIEICKASENDWQRIWPIFEAVTAEGDTYPYPSDITSQEAKSYWMGKQTETYIAMRDHIIVGTYYLKPNQPGHGSHIANAGFMVALDFRHAGIGRAMAWHALDQAKREQYIAMQFNAVVSTNTPAIKLWKSLGFKIIGTVPKGFYLHNTDLVDLYIMYKFL